MSKDNKINSIPKKYMAKIFDNITEISDSVKQLNDRVDEIQKKIGGFENHPDDSAKTDEPVSEEIFNADTDDSSEVTDTNVMQQLIEIKQMLEDDRNQRAEKKDESIQLMSALGEILGITENLNEETIRTAVKAVCAQSKAILEKDETITSQNKAIAEKNAKIISLNQTITEKEEEMRKFIDSIKALFKIDCGPSKKEIIAKAKSKLAEKENEITSLKITIEQHEATISQNTSQIASLQNTVSEKDVTIKQNTSQIASLQNTVSEKDAKIQQHEATIKQNTSRIEELTNTVSLRNAAIQQHEAIIKQNTSQIASLQNTVSEKDAKIQQNEATIKQNTSRIEELTNTVSLRNAAIQQNEATIKQNTSHIAELTNTVSAREATITQNMNEISALNGIISEYQTATEDFLKIFSLMQACTSLHKLIEEEFALPADGKLTIQEQIQFVNCFSDKTYFAECIYKALEEYQRGNGIQLTDAEKELINAVNAYYKNVFQIQWDILDCCDVTEGSKFNKEWMKNAKDPMNTYLLSVDYLCVPALRNLSSKIVEKAYIVGR